MVDPTHFGRLTCETQKGTCGPPGRVWNPPPSARPGYLFPMAEAERYGDGPPQEGRNTCPPCAEELDAFCEPKPERVCKPGEWCLFCGCKWEPEQ